MSVLLLFFQRLIFGGECPTEFHSLIFIMLNVEYGWIEVGGILIIFPS